MEFHHVARDDVSHRQLNDVPVTADGSLDGDRPFERVDGGFSLLLLHHVERDGKEDDDDDDDEALPVSRRARKCGRDEQNGNQRFGEAPRQLDDEAASDGRDYKICTVARHPLGGLSRGQAFRPCA